MMEMQAPPLPILQEAVAALHGRLTAGRTRATGTAVGSGLTGRLDTVPPDGLAILEAAMSDRHSARILEIWSRDDLHVAGASEDDWALATEIAYQAIRLGHSGAALAQLVEQVMRAGPYRRKWDDARGAVSWLAQDIANAIATVQKRLGARPLPGIRRDDDGDDELADDLPPAEETPEQTIARLERELGRARTVIATQQANVRRDREQRQGLSETLRRITDVLAIPTATLHPAGKVLTIVTLLEVHSRDGRGVVTLPDSALMKRSGLSKNTVNSFMQDLAAREGSPIDRRIKSAWVTLDDGTEKYEPISLVSPRYPTVNASLTAVISMSGPSDRAKAKAKAKRDRETERERRATPFGVCSDGDNDLVAVVGRCPQHDEIVGETIVRREDFELLNPNRWDPLPQQTPPCPDVLNGPTGGIHSGDSPPPRPDVPAIPPGGIRRKDERPAALLPGVSSPGGGNRSAKGRERAQHEAVSSGVRPADAALGTGGAPPLRVAGEVEARTPGDGAGAAARSGEQDRSVSRSGVQGSGVGVEAAVLASLSPPSWLDDWPDDLRSSPPPEPEPLPIRPRSHVARAFRPDYLQIARAFRRFAPPTERPLPAVAGGAE